MDGDGDDELLALLDDEYGRAILAEFTTEPMSASELCTARDMSAPTAYRRLERSQEADLVDGSSDTTRERDGVRTPSTGGGLL